MQYAPPNKSDWFKHLKYLLVMTSLSAAFSSSGWAIDPTVKELRIGFQKSSINFAIAKQQKLFEQEFPNAKIR